MKKRTGKEILTALLHDIAISVMGGLAAALGLAILLALIAGIVSGFQANTILNVLRSGLLIVGAMCLFVLSGVMLGQKSNEKIRSSQKWKELFHFLGPAPVLFFISATILAIAGVVDYIVWLS